ncbi:unnamed protein product [Acanthoscelides obtectus]|nr:unnamed protein product [Acanthoscelides obtectus]CAK1667776.1 Lipase member H [Acanthoscelides obtectus]
MTRSRLPFPSNSLSDPNLPLPSLPGPPELPEIPELRNIPELPDLSKLPTPQYFLQHLLNVTAEELLDVVANFGFDEVLYREVNFLHYLPDGTTTKYKINETRFDVSNDRPLKVAIHGWQSTGSDDFIKHFAESYHSIGINNVIGVDWSPHSKRNYLHSARATKKVGETVAQFILNALGNDSSKLDHVHIIGHSLGAQVAGFVGKHVQQLTNGLKLGRITALDAAGPLFELPLKLPSTRRVNKNDATYVDSIHTNVGFFGFLAPFADADFFINFGGPVQPGCMELNIFDAFSCSHGKSVVIYNNTITSKDYIGIQCSNPLRAISSLCNNNQRIVVGEHTSNRVAGQYFARVDADGQPYQNNGSRGLIGRSRDSVLQGIGGLLKI